MELHEAVRRRRAVRRFDPSPVAPAVLDRLVDLAARHPSAGGSGGRALLVLHRPDDVGRFWRAASGGTGSPDRWLAGMMTAPVVVLCLADPGAYAERYSRPDKARARADLGSSPEDPASWPVPWWDVDTGMAGLLLWLAAVDAGLAGCLVGVPGHRWDAVREAFGVPAEHRVVAAVALGRAAPGQPPARQRRPVGDVVHDGAFGRPWTAGGPEDA